MNSTNKKDVDGGWAWCVLIASYFNLLLCSGLGIIAGVFQIVLLEQFQGSVAFTSWVTALFSAFMQLGGPISSFVSNTFSCRTAVMLGGVLMFVSLGIVAGIGLGLIYTPSIVVVSYFFEQRRAIANGVILSGSGLGIFVMPQVAQFLYNNFTWRETFLIMGATSLQMCISGALMFSVHEKSNSSMNNFFGKVTGKHWRVNKKRSVQCDTTCYDSHNTHLEKSASNDFIQAADTIDEQYDSSKPMLNQNYCAMHVSPVDAFDDEEMTSKENVNRIDQDINGKLSVSKSEIRNKHLSNAVQLGSHFRSSHQDLIQKRPKDSTKLKENSASLQELSKHQSNDGNNSLKVTHTGGGIGFDRLNNSHKKLSRSCLGSSNSVVVVSRNPSLISGIASVHHLDIIALGSDNDLNVHNKSRTSSFLEQNIIVQADDLELPHSSEIADSENQNQNHLASSHSKTQYPPLHRNKIFWLLNVSLFVYNAGNGLYNIHVPSFYQSKGLSYSEITNCISCHGLMILVGRILAGALANAAKESTLILYIMMTILGGTCVCIMPPLGTTYAANMVLTSVIAIHAISIYALLPTLTIQYVGIQHLATAFGLEMVFAGSGYLVTPPLAGRIVDATGNYDYSMYISGSLFALGGIILFALPFMEQNVEWYAAITRMTKAEADAEEKESLHVDSNGTKDISKRNCCGGDDLEINNKL